MRASPDHGQLTEVLFERDKDPPFGISGCQDFLISRIILPAPDQMTSWPLFLSASAVPPQTQVSRKSLMSCFRSSAARYAHGRRVAVHRPSRPGHPPLCSQG